MRPRLAWRLAAPQVLSLMFSKYLYLHHTDEGYEGGGGAGDAACGGGIRGGIYHIFEETIRKKNSFSPTFSHML